MRNAEAIICNDSPIVIHNDVNVGVHHFWFIDDYCRGDDLASP